MAHFNATSRKTRGPQGKQGERGPGAFDFKGDWQPNTSYEKNDVVHFQGGGYISLKDHNSHTPVPCKHSEVWGCLCIPGTPGLNGLRGLEGPKGKDSEVPGPEGRQGPPGKDGRDGKDAVGTQGPPGSDGKDGVGIQGPPGKDGCSFRWKSAWNQRAYYEAGDVVKYLNVLWICLQAHSNQPMPSSYWDVFLDLRV